jgi:hypothetical protein
MRQYRYFDLIMAVFVTVLVVSNIASSAKIVDWGFSIFGVRMAFDAGTILFPVSYIFGDILTYMVIKTPGGSSGRGLPAWH